MLHALWTRFRKDPVQNALLLSVLAIHCVFILIILISPTFTVRKKNHKPLIVKTIVPKPVAKTVAVNKSQRQNVAPVAPPQVSAPKKKEAPKTEIAKTQVQPKKEAPAMPTLVKKAAVKKEPAIADKTVSKKPPSPTKKALPPQERAKISDSLLQELEQSIAKIENKGGATKTVKRAAAVAPITLQIDTAPGQEVSDEDMDYADLLVSHLHGSLSLPDYGEVKIQLSLRQDGSVVKLIVLKTQSEKNKQYLERELPHLRFPRFDGTYANKKEYTFILTFCNE